MDKGHYSLLLSFSATLRTFPMNWWFSCTHVGVFSLYPQSQVFFFLLFFNNILLPQFR